MRRLKTPHASASSGSVPKGIASAPSKRGRPQGFRARDDLTTSGDRGFVNADRGVGPARGRITGSSGVPARRFHSCCRSRLRRHRLQRSAIPVSHRSRCTTIHGKRGQRLVGSLTGSGSERLRVRCGSSKCDLTVRTEVAKPPGSHDDRNGQTVLKKRLPIRPEESTPKKDLLAVRRRSIAFPKEGISGCNHWACLHETRRVASLGFGLSVCRQLATAGSALSK